MRQCEDLRRFNGKHVKGEGNPNHKLTLEIVRNIRKEYSEGQGTITHKELGKKYNVSASSIGFIVTNKTWIENKERCGIK